MPPRKEASPYEDTAQQEVATKLNEAIDDFLANSRDLHEHELRVAGLTFELIKPLRKVFEQTQKHTQFRRAIYSLFGRSLEDDELRRFENDHNSRIDFSHPFGADDDHEG